jgi:hypothetical protein
VNEITNVETGEISPITEIPQQSGFSSASLVLSNDAMQSVMRIADLMASGKTTIPKHLQGSQGDCFAVSLQAMQWGMNPFSVAQKTHLVNGTLGYEAQLVIAVLNSSPALSTRLNFQWSDDWKGVNGKTDKSTDHWCRVWAILKGESEPRTLEVSMAQVGDVRNSPNWVSDPRQQIAYLTAKRWGRLHAPDVILGVYTPDELQDGEVYMAQNAPAKQTPAQVAQRAAESARPARTEHHTKIIAALETVAKELGFEPFKEEWSKLPKEDRAAIGLNERNRIGALATAQTVQPVDEVPQDQQRQPGADDE